MPLPDYKIDGFKLRDAREAKRLGFTALSLAAGITTGRLWQLEGKGWHVIDVNLLCRLEDALGFDACDEGIAEIHYSSDPSSAA